MGEQTSILVLDDDPLVLKSLQAYLEAEDYHVSTAQAVGPAAELLQERSFQVALVDVHLCQGNGFDLLQYIKDNDVPTAVIMFTGYGTIEDAVRAIKMGAFDYVTKPVSDEEVLLAVERALEHQKLLEENSQLRRQLNMSFQLDNFVCQDPKMQRALDMIGIVAATDCTVLITGESGTGKTMVARAIHMNSPRAGNPFLEVNCGALPDTLLESELFGHVKGAFSGAISQKKGKFEAADKGTIFLDEISLATPSLQMKLLRVLESFRFEPVGSNETRKVDVRIITATNKDLAELVRKNRFREDLYYRIKVTDIHLPPLRERPTEILPLAYHFINKYRDHSIQPISGISEEAARVLTGYEWPGNVRQLENTVQKALLFSQGPHITPSDLDVEASSPEQAVISHEEVLPLREAMKKVERQLILQCLKAANGNRKEAARLLEINRTTLYNKLHEHDIMEA